MPMTSWIEIVGERCDSCGYLASHYYRGGKLCCTCHQKGLAPPGYNESDPHILAERLHTAEAHIITLTQILKDKGIM